MRFLLKASEEKEDFYDLIGTDVTFASDIISVSGSISHHKGEKAFISDVKYNSGYHSSFGGESYWNEPKICSFKINGIQSCDWYPDTFVEYQKSKTH